MPYLDGTEDGNPHATLYWRKLEQAAVRDGKWKLIRAEGLAPMLYNLANDQSELKNVAKAFPERVVELTTKLERWEKELMDPLWQEGKQYVKIRKNFNEKFRDLKAVPETLGAK